MIMIIGGAYQGKYSYAKQWVEEENRWIDGETCEYDDIFKCGGINHFHLFVKRFMGSEAFTKLVQKLQEKNPEIVIVTDELGLGVVPVDASDRAWREKTGRIGTALAADAAEVHRVVCGIGMVIKGA